MRDAGRAQPPLRHETVGRRPGVQGTWRLPVDVHEVLLHDDAQLREVEVSIGDLQRVVGPLDEIESLRERSIPLGQLETQAEAASPVLFHDAQHVRPLHGASLLEPRQRVGKPHQTATRVEGAQQNAAALHRDDEDRHGHDVGSRLRSPYFDLELDDPSKVVERGKVSDHHCHRCRTGANYARLVIVPEPSERCLPHLGPARGRRSSVGSGPPSSRADRCGMMQSAEQERDR